MNQGARLFLVEQVEDFDFNSASHAVCILLLRVLVWLNDRETTRVSPSGCFSANLVSNLVSNGYLAETELLEGVQRLLLAVRIVGIQSIQLSEDLLIHQAFAHFLARF